MLSDFSGHQWNKIKENLIECLRLGKKDPYLFNYDDEIINSFGDYKKANNELVTDLKAYNLAMIQKLAQIILKMQSEMTAFIV